MGFDNTQIADLLTPGLTTVAGAPLGTSPRRGCRR
ncbi:hypothetical protein [Terrabacter terrigena]|uniref:Uncharacterized protein n=1 Tax=Terrabacter terrigena TaxID=574718 RepID=A0ABW3MSE6_9MICO